MIKTLLKGVSPLLCLALYLFTPAQASTLELSSPVPSTFESYLQSILYASPMMALPEELLEEEILEHSVAGNTLFPLLYPTHPASLESSAEEETNVLSFLKPVPNAPISSVYGMRWGRPHRGIDMAAPTGTPIQAAEDGKVIFSGRNGDFGNFVAIDHGHGYVTRYAHASSLIARQGQHVEKGQLIAKVGSTGRSTGPHLHFEVLAQGSHRNPQQFINQTISLAGD